MTSVDSGVETGNDSNDGTTIQQEGQQQVPNQVTGSDVMAVDSRGEFSNLNLYDWSALMQPLFVPNKKTTAETGRSSNNKMFEMIRNTNKASELLKPSDLCYRKIKERIWRRKGMGRGHAFAPNNWQTERIQRRMRWAATINNITLMKRLLEFGVSPNYHDKHGRSPLHISACRGYTEIVSLLLENGADPNQRDCIGNTPLHLAVINNRLSVVKPLLTAGTDVLALDSYGYNPLQLAKTKLRMLQRNYNNDDMKEMHNVINMLMTYLQKQKNLQEVAEELSSFCSRLSLSNILDQFQDDDVKDLL